MLTEQSCLTFDLAMPSSSFVIWLPEPQSPGGVSHAGTAAMLVRNLGTTPQLTGLRFEQRELQCLWMVFNYEIFDTYKNTYNRESPM